MGPQWSGGGVWKERTGKRRAEVKRRGLRIVPEKVRRRELLLQIKYSLVVILELNGVSEVQYKDVMMVDDGKYQ